MFNLIQIVMIIVFAIPLVLAVFWAKQYQHDSGKITVLRRKVGFYSKRVMK